MNGKDFTSTDLIAYCSYISTWEDESDDNINKIIAEHRALRAVPDKDPSVAVTNVIGDLESCASTLVTEIIAGNAAQITADAAALAAFWSFGTSLVILAVAEASVVADHLLVADKSKELNQKLEHADVKIAGQIDTKVKDYITRWKNNNKLIASKATTGLDTRHCRAILFQFMLHVECKEVLTAASFKKFAGVVRRFYHSNEIQAVYDALDDLHLSDKSNNAVKAYWKAFKAAIPSTSLSYDFARDLSITVLNVATRGGRRAIEQIAEEEGIAIDAVAEGIWDIMSGLGKFVIVLAVGWAIIDVFVNVVQIVHILDRYEALKDKLETDFKEHYIQFYKGVVETAKAYRSIQIKQ